ncbi:DUF2642 domain-containing protein [Paenibacillus mendelii]|uniref:DUF2642 domain-containing protein n=1 Tax=Paenibacillus mendelii TaxID=206163 RepID=A0ABV6J639_9BACL|nr:DUF2642 domain-containing protein [Paenibacillus mendelii]MCQ6560065.1 DUF2642 domain-containing protein [Paenibacillus mendelii]
MKDFQALISKKVFVDLSGKVRLSGKLVDAGSDIIVLLHQERYLYIPRVHVHQIKADLSDNEETSTAPQLPMEYENENISMKDILDQAMGLFLELNVSGHVPMHGYLTAVMEDYLVLHSPVYKQIHVSLHHMKWLIPYPVHHVPYSLDRMSLAVKPYNSPLPPTFEEQCKRIEGNLAVFDLGHTIGFIQQVSSGTITFIDANGNPMYWNVAHLKSLYLP